MFVYNNISAAKISSTITIINLIQKNFVHYLPLIFTIFGTIGFIGNVITFLQPNLRKNTFCLYFLIGSIFDVLNLYIDLLPNYIYNTENILLMLPDTTICRWKVFALAGIPQISMNFLILSLIDRYSSTSGITSSLNKIRKIKNVPYFTIITIIVSCVITLYSPLLYKYVPGFGCVPTDTLANGILYLCIQGLLTPLLMLIFACLTFRNMKRSRQRVSNIANVRIRRTRYQFINTVCTQVIVTSFFLLQWMIFYLYHIITLYDNRTADEWTTHYFIFGVTNALYYIINVKSFYLSTLTSRLFRETLMKSVLKLFGKITGKQTGVTGTQTVTVNAAH